MVRDQALVTARWYFWPLVLLAAPPVIALLLLFAPIALVLEAVEAIQHRRHARKHGDCLRCMRADLYDRRPS